MLRVAVGAVAGLVLALVAITGAEPAAGPTWSTLVPPGPRADGWSVSPARRGDEHDVVFVVRRGPERVEVHVLARGAWSGVPETASFGVGWEGPRTSAAAEVATDVTARVAEELRARDPGRLDVDAVPLEPSARPAPSGAGGLALALALLALVLVLPRTRAVATTTSLVLGLAVRAPDLDLPFARDQDVQRLLSGALPMSEILFGRGLDDRHPPLWFVVLHVAELAGQSAWAARLPSVIAGALIAPALLACAHEARPGERPSSGLLAIATLLALSPPLVAISREVGELAFFALVVVLLVLAIERARRAPTRVSLGLVALLHALPLYTYYTGIFVTLASCLALWLGSADANSRALRRAALAGLAAGLPALALAARIAFRDAGARAAAHARPDLAWGDAGVLELSSAMLREVGAALGVGLVVIAIVAGARGRPQASRSALVIAALTIAGTAALAPFARIQPYTALAIVPVLALAAALAVDTLPTGPGRSLATASVVLACALPLASAWPALAAQHAADPDAVVGRYVERARDEHVTRIATVAAYDATLVAYHVARSTQRPLAWSDLDAAQGELALPDVTPRVGYLAASHDGDEAPGPHAAERLRAWIAAGPVAVMARDTFSLPEVDRILDACTPLDRSPGTRLLLCEPSPAAR